MNTKILLDTHIALWSLYESGRLSEEEKKLLESTRNDVYVSLASVWEVAIKNRIGKSDVNAEVFLDDCIETGFEILPIEAEHILGLYSLPDFVNGHRDPFDRMLMSQALSEQCRLFTKDGKILQYDLPIFLKADRDLI